MISDRRLAQGRLGFAAAGGFTFIEMLVAVMLLGLLLTIAYGGMRAGTRSADRGEQYIELVNRVRVTHELLRNQLQRAAPLPMVIDGTDSVVFEGEPQRLRYVAPMPGYLGRGGAQIQELSFERGEGGMVLAFRHHYWETSDQPLNFDEVEVEPVILLDRIKEASFRYMARPSIDDEEPDWTDDWEDTSRVPWLIELELEFSDHVPLKWPMLLVAPMIDGSSATEDDWLAPYRQPGQRRDRQ